MKEYQRKIPQIVIGQTAGDFLAEYMAGGIMVILGLNLKEGEKCNAKFVGTGMHGGVIYERGEILEPVNGTKTLAVGKRDLKTIEALVYEYCGNFGTDPKKSWQANSRKYCQSQSDHTRSYILTNFLFFYNFKFLCLPTIVVLKITKKRKRVLGFDFRFMRVFLTAVSPLQSRL